MQLLHRRDNKCNIRERRRTTPRLDASTVGNWDIMPLRALERRARGRLLNQMLLQQKQTRKAKMMIVP